MHDKRSLSFICECCYHKLPGSLTMEFPKIINNSDMHIDATGSSYLYGKCPKCKNKSFWFTVDSSISEAISILNQNGYPTDFSCQGHSYVTFRNNENTNKSYHIEYHYDTPYISFSRSNKSRSLTLLNLFIEAGFDHFYFCKSGTTIDHFIPINFNVCSREEFAVYLNKDYIEQQYKEIVKQFEEKSASKDILYEIDKKIDKIFEDKCKELGKLLKKNKDII